MVRVNEALNQIPPHCPHNPTDTTRQDATHLTRNMSEPFAKRTKSTILPGYLLPLWHAPAVLMPREELGMRGSRPP